MWMKDKNILKPYRLYWDFAFLARLFPLRQVPSKNNNGFYFFVFPKFAGQQSSRSIFLFLFKRTTD